MGRAAERFDYTEAESTAVESADEIGRAAKQSQRQTVSSIDDDYVQRTLASHKPLPPITWKNFYREINIVSTLALTVVPILAIYGAATTKLRWQTALWAVIYYFYTGLGITAGYHRLWAHRSYNASKPLQYFLAAGGSGAVEGSIRWWSRGHRAHHRYTDTDLDPYSAHKGLLWSHIGWMIVKPRRKPGVADVSDLSRNSVVKWQHKFYLPLILGMGFIFPTVVAGLLWGDYRGGFFYAACARLLFVHHSTFCVNSLAHWLGDAPFDSKHSPRDHIITALVTIGEGYHNFHHEFPQDFRNAIKWHQYDPTKWFIWTASKLGLASELKTFPDNEVRKGRYNQELKKLEELRGTIAWPKDSNDLPILNWDSFQKQVKESGRLLVVESGFILDVTDFINEHPGGYALIRNRNGKDISVSFNGGVYDHSNAAHNLASMLRVGALEGGYEVEALKEKPSIKTYAGPAFEREEAERKEKEAKLPRNYRTKPTKLPKTLPAYATDALKVDNVPISANRGHSADATHAFVKAGPPPLAVGA